MTSDETERKADTPDTYEIVVVGRLDTGWKEWFGPELSMEFQGNRTILTGPIIDQSSLHGMIRKIRNLGVPLISVRRLNDKGE